MLSTVKGPATRTVFRVLVGLVVQVFVVGVLAMAMEASIWGCRAIRS